MIQIVVAESGKYLETVRLYSQKTGFVVVPFGADWSVISESDHVFEALMKHPIELLPTHPLESS